MKQELREELNQLIRDWQAWAATVTISLPGIVAFFLRVQGNPEVLFVGLCIFVLLLDVSSSCYILFAKKKEQSIYIATPAGGQRQKSVAKYRLLQPYAKVSLLCSVLIGILFAGIPPINQPFTDVVWGTRTPTPTLTPMPTQTLTLTPSPTITITPSPRPLSDSLYYVIVYDSSMKMDESFHGEKKWQVARNLLVEILNGLNPRAQYSLVTIGGSNSPGNADPCQVPDSPTLSFSPRQAVYDYFGSLRPQGVGSFYKAYILAKNQLEDLPRDTIRTLIYITGSDDACATEDEWTALKNLVSFPDSTFGIYSQIIILDEDGIRSQSLAEKFNSLSNSNINAQAPQSISEIQGNGVTLIHIVNNVNVYIDRAIATLTIETPRSATPFVPATNTAVSGVTLIAPQPTLKSVAPTALPPTAIPPTHIPPTPIPPTPIPQPTSTPSPSVELLSAEYLNGGESCSVRINFKVTGGPATGRFHVWNTFYGPDGDVYPQIILPVGPNGYEVGLGGHGDPAYYRHKVWFAFDGIPSTSNVLSDLICPGLTPVP